MKNKGKRLGELFTVFFKIGAFTFGGGYAMIPIIQKEVTENRDWLTGDDLLDIIAIAESTPGPIAINTATFVGYRFAGVTGAALATLGVVLPPFLVISLLSRVLNAVQDIKAVQYAFMGIRAGVLALLIKALWSMYKKCPRDAFSLCLMGLSFLAVALLNVPVIWVLLACALSGLLTLFVKGRKKA